MSGGKGITQSFLTKLDQVDTSDVEGVGKIRREGSKMYKYVKLLNDTATVAGVAGDLVSYAAATGYPNNVVVLDDDDADAATPFGAGALVAAVAGVADTAYYLWIQIRGQCTLSNAVVSGAVGSHFIKADADKTGTIATNGVASNMGTSYNTTTGVCLNCPQ